MDDEHGTCCAKMATATADLFFSPYSCFISDPAVFFATFLAPICVIIVFNSVIFILVTRVLIVHTRRKRSELSIKNVIKPMIAIVYLMMLLGLPWLFGALTVKEASTTFQYLFSIFSGFQGFFISLYHCVNSEEGRNFLCFCWRSRSKLTLHLLVL